MSDQSLANDVQYGRSKPKPKFRVSSGRLILGNQTKPTSAFCAMSKSFLLGELLIVYPCTNISEKEGRRMSSIIALEWDMRAADRSVLSQDNEFVGAVSGSGVGMMIPD